MNSGTLVIERLLVDVKKRQSRHFFSFLPPGTTGLGPKGEDGVFLGLGGVALYGPSLRVTLA